MPLVTTERSGHVLTISLNRDDKLNAFNYPMLRELAEAYTELAQDKTLRVGVLRANGRYFTSGLDLGELFPELYNSSPSCTKRPSPRRFPSSSRSRASSPRAASTRSGSRPTRARSPL